MDENIVLDKRTVICSLEGNAAYIDTENGRYLLNDTIKIVWDLINGSRNIGEIITMAYEKYGDGNTLDEVKDIVNEAVHLLLGIHLVEIREKDMFEGWIKYE